MTLKRVLKFLLDSSLPMGSALKPSPRDEIQEASVGGIGIELRVESIVSKNVIPDPTDLPRASERFLPPLRKEPLEYLPPSRTVSEEGAPQILVVLGPQVLVEVYPYLEYLARLIG